MQVVAPASSANLGPGFDTLGLALNLPFHLSVDDDPGDFLPCEPTHPAAVAFVAAGGSGPLFWRSPIPSGRGLGFSGAARVAGAFAGFLHAGADPADARSAAFDLAAGLEGHADNAAASTYGGLTVTAGGRVVRLPVPDGLEVVAWWPDSSVATDRARAALPELVPLVDAAFNIGRVALLVAAFAAGDTSTLALATQDRIHQERRLGLSPESATALSAVQASEPLAAWLSGSGPTVAALVHHTQADRALTAFGEAGTARRLKIDSIGVRVVEG
jgi:homoserine kinase